MMDDHQGKLTLLPHRRKPDSDSADTHKPPYQERKQLSKDTGKLGVLGRVPVAHCMCNHCPAADDEVTDNSLKIGTLGALSQGGGLNDM